MLSPPCRACNRAKQAPGHQERRGGSDGIAGSVRWYHAVLAVNDEREDALAAEAGGLR